MPFHSLNEAGEDRLQSLPADAVRRLPDNDQGFADGLIIHTPALRHSWLRSSFGQPQQPGRMLPMAPYHRC